MPDEQQEQQEPQFAVLAEKKDHSKPLVLTHLPFGRLIDDVILPYAEDEPFFIDGVPVQRDQLERIKIIQQKERFGPHFDDLHLYLRWGDLQRQKLYADQYQTRLDALLRELGEDVTSQAIKAFNTEIKPRLRDYLAGKREELIGAAYQLFLASVKILGPASGGGE